MKWIRQAHHKTIRFIFVVLVIGASVLCSPAKGGAEANEMRLVEGNNKFALALYEELRAKEGNLFFSPYSISTALAMAYAGAQGRTESQISPRCWRCRWLELRGLRGRGYTTKSHQYLR